VNGFDLIATLPFQPQSIATRWQVPNYTASVRGMWVSNWVVRWW